MRASVLQHGLSPKTRKPNPERVDVGPIGKAAPLGATRLANRCVPGATQSYRLVRLVRVSATPPEPQTKAGPVWLPAPGQRPTAVPQCVVEALPAARSAVTETEFAVPTTAEAQRAVLRGARSDTRLPFRDPPPNLYRFKPKPFAPLLRPYF